MGLFKKKNNQKEENTAAAADQRADLKQMVLTNLNEKLSGTLYDDCVIMPKGFTIDVQIGRMEESEGIKILQTIFIIKHDDFDEPLIEPVDSQGPTDEDAAKMAVEIFMGGVWHPLDQSMTKKNPTHISVDFLRQHYDFDMYAQSVVRIGVKNKPPTMLINFIRNEIPKYLGSKKYYWLRVYLAKYKERRIIEVRINGSVCVQLNEYFKEYVEKEMDASEAFVSEKQYAIFVQREDDKCPFDKDLVMNAARETIKMMVGIRSNEDYIAMTKKLEENFLSLPCGSFPQLPLSHFPVLFSSPQALQAFRQPPYAHFPETSLLLLHYRCSSVLTPLPHCSALYHFREQLFPTSFPKPSALPPAFCGEAHQHA